jgi:hypothetical protein
MSDITSANSVFTLVCAQVFPVPVQLQGYAVDDAFTVESVPLSESFMGVDGKKSQGYTPAIVPMSVNLMPDSPSIAVFDAIAAYIKVTRSIPEMSGTITLPSTSRSYTLTNGSLKAYKPFPDAKKVLQSQAFGIDWESVDMAVI